MAGTLAFVLCGEYALVELLYYPGVNLLAGEAKALVVHPAPGEGLQSY
jgi:hypothetical protein